jgi:hypothetical protein
VPSHDVEVVAEHDHLPSHLLHPAALLTYQECPGWSYCRPDCRTRSAGREIKLWLKMECGAWITD